MLNKIIPIAIIGLFLFAMSCGKEINRVEPDNSNLTPFGNNGSGGSSSGPTIDSASFLGLNNFIFSKKCAVPACHDGSFEPDFRTIEGAYNSLVYHDVIKNNATNDFTYRVVPNDTALSWLHERITTDDANLGKMPLYDVMSEHEIEQIEQWILTGAKNVFDVAPSQPNLQPSTGGVLAYLNDTSGVRLDTARDSQILPMKFPNNSSVQLWFLLFDTDINGDFIPGSNLSYNKIKISDHPFDYSGVTESNLNLLPALSPALLPIPFGGNNLAPFYHNYTINTSNYTPGRTYYARVYVQDANHPFVTEIPEDGSQPYLFTYFSFIVQ